MTQMTYPAGSRELARGHMVGTATAELCLKVHKWRDLLPALRMAREALGLNRSRLDLLEKLLACVPGDHPAPDGQGRLIVYASNARLAEMTNRSNDKIITRLITELEERGLLCRQSSANGKRYARRAPDGSITAFGIDLGPLLARVPEILDLSRAAQMRAEECHRLREACGRLVAELGARAGQGTRLPELLEEARRMFRRKPCATMLSALLRQLRDVAGQAAPTEDSGATAPQNTCHFKPTQNHSEENTAPAAPTTPPNPHLVEKALPRVAGLGRQIRGSLRDLVDGMLQALGIKRPLWHRCLESFGFEEAALMLMVIYERQRHIRHAPGYLAHLVRSCSGQPRPGTQMLTAML